MPRAIVIGLVMSSVLACVATLAATGQAPRETTSADADLTVFKTWLKARYGAYRCDEGPARFRNPMVEAVYPGRQFYYVLTYARGIPLPFRNAVSMIAVVEHDSVRALRGASIGEYREGLRRVRSLADARAAAAGVLILTLGDPGQRRWRIDPKGFRVQRSAGGWRCSYGHDANYVSEVRFDRRGLLSSVQCNVPPVP